ncbi:MAG: hypothetical protein M5U31_04260 [Acidimicrobiia bacterium]|nr:hypothetical protein [Acidimicrobiia bacterium]
MTDPATIRSLLGGDIDAPGVDALVDEAVSAELDGSLDALAADLGVDPDALAGAVRDVDDYRERRSALSSARDALRSPALATAPLDEVTRRRLVRSALDVARDDTRASIDADANRRRRFVPRLGTAAVAAAVLAVVAVGAVFLTQRADDHTASDQLADAPAGGSADAGSATATDEEGVEDLGDVTDDTTVGDLVGERLGTTLTGPNPDEVSAQQEGAPALAQEPSVSGDNTSGAQSTEPDAAPSLDARGCADRLRGDFAGLGDPVLVATVHVDGAQRVLVVYEVAERTIILSGDLPTCTTLPVESFATAE